MSNNIPDVDWSTPPAKARKVIDKVVKDFAKGTSRTVPLAPRPPKKIPDTIQLLIEIRGWMEGKKQMLYFKNRAKEIDRFIDKINKVVNK